MKSLCTHFRKLPKIQQLLIDVYFLLFQSHGLFYIGGWSGPTKYYGEITAAPFKTNDLSIETNSFKEFEKFSSYPPKFEQI